MFIALALWAAAPAAACGGFFCSSTTTTTTTTTTTETLTVEAPVNQKSERILFAVNEAAGTVSAFVEVSYIRDIDVPFSWIIPIPTVIDALDVTTATAEMFNVLEEATAPSFSFEWVEQNTNYNTNYNYGSYNYGGYNYGYDDSRGGGCSFGCAGTPDKTSTDLPIPRDDISSTSWSTTTGQLDLDVAVVDEAVVGPFAIEVITATDAADFGTWLQLNGYDMPETALGPLAHYIGEGFAFLGVHLAPDVPEGPIDTLVFTYPSTSPGIPLILTKIATCPELPIIAYVLANEQWGPDNWLLATNPGPATLPQGNSVDYEDRVKAELARHGGHAFIRERAAPISDLVLPEEWRAQLGPDLYLTRLRGLVTPEQMDEDPCFAPLPLAEDVDSHYSIVLDRPIDEYRSGAGGAWLLLPLLALGRRRRA